MKRNAAFLEGQEAYRNGRDSNENPFWHLSPEALDWDRGFMAAARVQAAYDAGDWGFTPASLVGAEHL